jgi:phosphoribosylanthranilate isomerase
MVVKVCGMTRREDAVWAAEQGATALGFVCWPASPRYVPPERIAEIGAALPPDVERVGVFVNAPAGEIRTIVSAAQLTVVQLHGDEAPELAARIESPVWRAVTLSTPDETYQRWPDGTVFVLDAADPVRRGGTGRTVDWTAAGVLARRRPLVLAGGLTPETVAAAIATVRPIGVDVSSGVERAPGIKDHDKVARFVATARSALGQR